MTDQAVYAAVARLHEFPARFRQHGPAGSRIVRRWADELEDACAEVCDALAEARQQLAAQVEETTRERTWCQTVAAQLKAAERQLATQVREIVGLQEQFSEVSANWHDALGTIRAQAQEIAKLREELDRTVRFCDDRAKHHAEMCQKALDKGCGIKARERLLQKIEAQACAATIRAVRTPQEPT